MYGPFTQTIIDDTLYVIQNISLLLCDLTHYPQTQT